MPSDRPQGQSAELARESLRSVGLPDSIIRERRLQSARQSAVRAGIKMSQKRPAQTAVAASAEISRFSSGLACKYTGL
jgi:hypothetical protein